jgi:hypothetical protein
MSKWVKIETVEDLPDNLTDINYMALRPTGEVVQPDIFLDDDRAGLVNRYSAWMPVYWPKPFVDGEIDELTEAQGRINSAINVGHNLDCLFCGFKDRVLIHGIPNK